MTTTFRDVMHDIGRRVWARFENIGGTSAVVNAAVTLIAACFALFTYWALWQDVVKLQSEDVVRVDPEHRVIDRSIGQQFLVTRRVCVRSHVQAFVQREFVGGVIYQTPPEAAAQFQKGCHERARMVDIPPTLPPGQYTYRVSLNFCNQLRCERVYLHDIPIAIRGTPAEPNAPAGPIREPV